MIKNLLIFMLFPMLVQAQGNVGIKMLFDSLKANPQTIADELIMDKALMGKKMATSNLYPNISLFGSFDYANTPTGMLPIAPNDLLKMVQDQTVPQPFSDQILRVGATFSMPLFVKSIYTMASKAKMMYQSAASKKRIDLLKNEAMLVGLNANLAYIESLDTALGKKLTSLNKTKEIIDLKVKNNRAPRNASLMIDDGINQVHIMRNNLLAKKEEIIASIASLTGIRLTDHVPMTQIGTYQNGGLKALDPLKEKIKADKLTLRAEKEKLWPILVLRGNYNHSMANAYNNNLGINEDFATVGLVLKVPLFTKPQYTKISLTKIDLATSENKLAQLNLELSSQANMLENNLKIVDQSIELYSKSIKDKEDILTSAKVSYEAERMTVQDYLKFEDDVVLEKAKLYKAHAERWQTLLKLAVIYGNNIEEIIK